MQTSRKCAAECSEVSVSSYILTFGISGVSMRKAAAIASKAAPKFLILGDRFIDSHCKSKRCDAAERTTPKRKRNEKCVAVNTHFKVR